MKAFSYAIGLLLLVFSASAHIGSPNVYFEGSAGPYPIRVVIRPPGVVPGLAEINVRVLHGHASQVTVFPVFWDAGKEGSPPPDLAKPNPGDTNLYSATLWLMKPGAYTVNVTVQGNDGRGAAIVPVNSVATTRNAMPAWFGAMLVGLGLVLFAGAVTLTGAAFGQSTWNPGIEPSRRRRWLARIATVAGAIFFGALLLLGRVWWNFVDRDYRNNRLYQPVQVSASVRSENEQPILNLTVVEETRHWAPLIPDHGKLMHLFLVREPQLDVFAHLHPVQKNPRTFDAALPPLPAGEYDIYADVTHETGFSETLLTKVQLPAIPKRFEQLARPLKEADPICSPTGWLGGSTNLFFVPDRDDSWRISGKDAAISAAVASALDDSLTMVWEKPASDSPEAHLDFKLVLANGEPAPLELYLGMFGHAAVRHRDGTVFAHLHPGGTFSMGSQMLFSKGANNRSRWHASTNEAMSGATAMMQHEAFPVGAGPQSVSFPYEFPKPGAYRLWVQMKSGGKVYTGVFDTVSNLGESPRVTANK